MDIAILGASYLQLPLIKKAKQLGYTTHVFAWAANDVGEKEADYFYPISIVEKNKIFDKCKEIGICGICSIASDIAVATVNYVSEKLNLTGNPINSTGKCTNKYLMRQAFFEHNIPCPKSFLIDEECEISNLPLKFPAIVKPTDRSGSRGIYKVNSKKQVNDAVLKSIKESFENKAVIEEFVGGDEYSVEYISFNGEHHFLAVTQKYTTGEPHFIETAHVEPACLSNDILEKVKKIIPKALDALDIKYGASHSEIKIDSYGNISVIEIGARMGGDCIGSDLVMYSTGLDYLRMVIDVSCGKRPNFSVIGEKRAVKSVFMFSQKDINEFNYIQKNFPKKIIRVVDFHPENLGKTTDSSNRVGCYIIEL